MNLTNSQYETLMYHYYDTQAASHREMEERRREVLKKLPELEELEAKARHLSLSFVRDTSDASTDSQALDNLKQELEELKNKRRELLEANGWSEDYLDPIYECPDCHDTGYIGGKKCHCLKKRAVEYCYMQSNLSDILSKENFDTFDLSLYSEDDIDDMTERNARDTMREIYEEAKKYTKNFDTEPGNLLLYGDTGVDKSFLSHCIAKELLDSGHSVLYLSANRFFDMLAARQFDNTMKYEEKNTTISYILDCDLLILDDLGTELNNAFTASQLYHCIESRLLGNHATIISTNLSFKSINERYTERVFSRIMSNYRSLRLFGSDLRLTKHA